MALSKPEAIFWDFDGVLMDSNAVRDRGFEAVLADHPREQVEKLLAFHRANGGLSRYVKFRYFLEKVRGEAATEDRIHALATAFSEHMRKALVDPRMLIEENLALVRRHGLAIPMHVVSGSDQAELRFLCREMELDGYFASIHGSPEPKTELVAAILRERAYDPGRCVLVGDSYNDRDAAQANGVAFSGYGNPYPEFPAELEEVRILRLS
jgi:phosphoglycolate phosphatase-like HAD superfamily hydrolase